MDGWLAWFVVVFVGLSVYIVVLLLLTVFYSTPADNIVAQSVSQSQG
jgi:hypothetical protein